MSSLKTKVTQVLEKMRPAIQAHGGDLKLLKAEKDLVTIRILGACLGCPYSQDTFGTGMEEMIKKEVPEVKKIKFVI